MSGSGEHMDFAAFEAEDFDAYAQEKWNSNMFTLQRRKVRNKLAAIGEHLSQMLNTAHLPLVMHLSDEFPSLWNKKRVDAQWLFFSRDEVAKGELTDLIDKERTLADTLADPTPRYRHVFLGVAVFFDHLEIGLRLHHDAWVDRKNLLNLLLATEHRQRLQELLSALPDHYEIGRLSGHTQAPGNFGEPEIDALAQGFDTDRQWLFMGARLPRDQVLVLGSDVVETAKEVFELLVPIYRFCAWSPENDAISLDMLVAERAEALEANRETLEKEKAKRAEARRKKEQQAIHLRAEIEEKYLETQAWRQREQAARRAAAARAAQAAKEEDARARAEALAANWKLEAPTKRPERNRAENRTEEKIPDKKTRPAFGDRRKEQRRERPPERRSTPPPETGSDIAVGHLVEVKKGFLRGRRGVVWDIDEKGTIKIHFGALSSRLTADEIRSLGPAPASSWERGRRGGFKKRPR
ncbi:MAG: hypothetical protein QNJ97_00940 [Myxococcota bacterium]|nr:hypothetical protein [Myxococcota bacterium]